MSSSISDTTSIFDLPTDPIGGSNHTNHNNNHNNTTHNIHMTATESATSLDNNNKGAMTLDQTTINQIVNGLQQATLSGATQLSSRDIPMTSTGLSADPQVMPNYIPPPPPLKHNDYINAAANEKTSDIINVYNAKQTLNTRVDDMYNEIQMPLLISVIYFLFQLPFFRKIMQSYFGFCFSNDGNYNVNGFMFTSILFGLLFHVLMKAINIFA